MKTIFQNVFGLTKQLYWLPQGSGIQAFGFLEKQNLDYLRCHLTETGVGSRLTISSPWTSKANLVTEIMTKWLSTKPNYRPAGLRGAAFWDPVAFNAGELQM